MSLPPQRRCFCDHLDESLSHLVFGIPKAGVTTQWREFGQRRFKLVRHFLMNTHRFFFVVPANSLSLHSQFGKFLFQSLLCECHCCVRLSTRLCYFLQTLLPCDLGLLAGGGRVRFRTFL